MKDGDFYFSDINNTSRTSFKVVQHDFFWNYGNPSGGGGSSDDIGTLNGISPNSGIEINLKLVLENQESYVLKRELTPWQDTPNWPYYPEQIMVTTSYEVSDLKAEHQLFS